MEDYLENCLSSETLSTAAQIKRRHLLDKFYALGVPPNVTRHSAAGQHRAFLISTLFKCITRNLRNLSSPWPFDLREGQCIPRSCRRVSIEYMSTKYDVDRSRTRTHIVCPRSWSINIILGRHILYGHSTAGHRYALTLPVVKRSRSQAYEVCCLAWVCMSIGLLRFLVFCKINKIYRLCKLSDIFKVDYCLITRWWTLIIFIHCQNIRIFTDICGEFSIFWWNCVPYTF